MVISQNGPNGSNTLKFGSINAYMLNGQNVVHGPKKSAYHQHVWRNF